ncbi:MAG: serine/threonine protein kinase [Candidatus Obscuribacterales bacterium]|nr:serine/threonine protein kinase [Candidatus Obscuribacterales bacterium]
MTSIGLFAAGLPALLTYFIYLHLGIDAKLGFPSQDPAFGKVFLVYGLYLSSLASCLSVLFFRCWFSFPLNFLGNEETIEFNSWGIRRRSHSWLTQVLTLNNPGAGPVSLPWQEVVALRSSQMRTPFYPLPTKAFPRNSLIYRLLNKVALFVDGIIKTQKKPDVVYFTTSEWKEGVTGSRINSGRTICVNLGDLDAEERQRLFWATKHWAPHVMLDDVVQEQILGSKSLQEPGYTELWFELLTDNMQVKDAGTLLPGTKRKKGRLTVRQRFSSGGQANIYLADSSDGGQVILKEFILSTADAFGALLESAGEFESEATLLSELLHPRIVKMHSFFAENRRLYIELEKIDGMSLRDWVKSGGAAFSEEQVVDIALQVSEVLQYLHGHNPPVVHRDISPDNLMFSDEKGVTVIDFSLSSGKKSNRTSNTMGKHSYSPPEQFRDEACPQSDIYALGATIYFLLTGADPKPISQSDLRACRDDISEQLCEIVKRATAFELSDRYQSVEWLRLELETLKKSWTE